MNKRFGKPGLDRGQRVHGAKWVFVTPAGDMINYRQLKEQGGQKHDDWILFKSMKEAKRWIGLLGMQAAGGIRNLTRQVRFDLVVARPDGLKMKIGVYIADHVYEQRLEPQPLDARAHAGDGDVALRELSPVWFKVVEDVKGYKEDLYVWKRRHFEAQYGIVITEF